MANVTSQYEAINTKGPDRPGQHLFYGHVKPDIHTLETNIYYTTYSYFITCEYRTNSSSAYCQRSVTKAVAFFLLTDQEQKAPVRRKLKRSK